MFHISKYLKCPQITITHFLNYEMFLGDTHGYCTGWDISRTPSPAGATFNNCPDFYKAFVWSGIFIRGGGYSLGVWEQNPSVGSRGEDPGRKSENVDEVSKKPKQFADIVCRF